MLSDPRCYGEEASGLHFLLILAVWSGSAYQARVRFSNWGLIDCQFKDHSARRLRKFIENVKTEDGSRVQGHRCTHFTGANNGVLGGACQERQSSNQMEGIYLGSIPVREVWSLTMQSRQLGRA